MFLSTVRIINQGNSKELIKMELTIPNHIVIENYQFTTDRKKYKRSIEKDGQYFFLIIFKFTFCIVVVLNGSTVFKIVVVLFIE